ncbi:MULTISPECIES: hypothetical protein [Streptomyces]|uniref:hypothetical protein n=1 Tax=Streptomyces TaxID=1883 RepID=UPI000A6893C5|nr:MULTISPECIES: hypothetical protein [Streptomyces]MYS95951.1 hypothetical protein [Streptomyces sp. SID5469]
MTSAGGTRCCGIDTEDVLLEALAEPRPLSAHRLPARLHQGEDRPRIGGRIGA